MDIKATIHLSDADIVALVEKFGSAALGGVFTPPVEEAPPPPVRPALPVLPHHDERMIGQLIYDRLKGFRHIIPVAKTTAEITKDVIEYLQRQQVVNIPKLDDATYEEVARGLEQAAESREVHLLRDSASPSTHTRSDHGRVIIPGLSLARAVANRWKEPTENGEGQFTRVDVAQWLRESGHNPASAQAVLGYLEGAGIVVATARLKFKKGRSMYLYRWGRRMQDDEEIYCHGPTGIHQRRSKELPVRRMK